MITDKILNYGIDPPQNSKPYWGNDNPNEDDIVSSIDYKLSLQKLSKTEKEIIQLFNDGYSEREISSMINIDDTAVHRIKERAINKLKEMMNGKDSIHSLFA